MRRYPTRNRIGREFFAVVLPVWAVVVACAGYFLAACALGLVALWWWHRA